MNRELQSGVVFPTDLLFVVETIGHMRQKANTIGESTFFKLTLHIVPAANV